MCHADVHPERSTVRDSYPIYSHDDSHGPVVSKGSDESMPPRRVLDSSVGIYSRKIHGASLTKDRKVCSGHVWNLMCRPTESLPEGKFWECSTTFGYGRSAQDLHQCQPELTIEEDCVKIGLMHCFALTTEEDCVKNGMMQYCFALANQEDCVKKGMMHCMMIGGADHLLTEFSPMGKYVFDERTKRTSNAKWAHPIEVSRGAKHLVRGATQLV